MNITGDLSDLGGVSLFTREWIEMFRGLMPKKKRKSLPLYEGVD